LKGCLNRPSKVAGRRDPFQNDAVDADASDLNRAEPATEAVFVS
jgi:hypothetical protein